MVLQHLYRGHVRCVDVVRGYSVAALQEVHVLHVELAYAFSVELDAAVVRHLDSRHTLQHVSYHTVSLLPVGSDGVVERVPLLTYLLWTDAYLLQLHGLLADSEINPLRTVDDYFHLVSYRKSRGCYGHTVRLSSELQFVVALTVGVGKAYDTAGAFHRHGDIGVHGFALGVKYSTLDYGLCLHTAMNGYDDKDEGNETELHGYYKDLKMICEGGNKDVTPFPIVQTACPEN